MKNLLFLTTTFAFLFAACDQVEKVGITDVSAPIEAAFTIESADTNRVFKTEMFDASTNKDFMDNRSKIDNLEISAVQYRLKAINIASADSLIEGYIEYKNPVTGSFDVLSRVTNKKLRLNIAENVPFDANVANNLANAMRNNPYRAEVRFRGEMDKKPVSFVINVIIYLKLKVKI